MPTLWRFETGSRDEDELLDPGTTMQREIRVLYVYHELRILNL